MTDESGQYLKLRKNGSLWLPFSLLGVVVGMAVAWGTNANRLANVEQKIPRMEEHIEADDRAIAVIQSQMQAILEQLHEVNAKLDRQEEARR